MDKFSGERRPPTLSEDDAVIEEIFRSERRPAPKELENFVVTTERWQKALELYRKDRQWMIDAAAKSRDKATSYRCFLVGCAAMGIEPNLPLDEPVLYYSGNFKLTPEEVKGENKRCAERNVMDAARGQAKVIMGLVTVSKETHTGDSTKTRDVLHPCRDCRDMFRKYLAEGLVREDSILCYVNDSKKEVKMEEHTLKEFLNLYADDYMG